MWPALIVSNVISTCRMVVLPEPLGPMRARFSPGFTAKLGSFSIRNGPKLFEMRSTSMIGVDVTLPPTIVMIS